MFGAAVGSSKLGAATGVLVTRVAEWGNYIPGPGEPDPAFGGGEDAAHYLTTVVISGWVASSVWVNT